MPNVLSQRDLVTRPDNMDETVPHTLLKSFLIFQYIYNISPPSKINIIVEKSFCTYQITHIYSIGMYKYFKTKLIDHKSDLFKYTSDKMSLVVRKPAFAYAKTKTQISFAVTAKLISVFVFATRIVQSLYFLNPKFQASSHLLWSYSLVCVGPCRKPRRPVFSQRGSNDHTIIP